MPEARSGYHHGDPRDALVQAALAMSGDRAEAIVRREASRRVGVTARAACCHFADRDALVRAVAQAALAKVARTIEQKQRDARDGLTMPRRVGEGEIRVALDESGRFDVAFFGMATLCPSAIAAPRLGGDAQPAAAARTGFSLRADGA